MRFKLKFWSLGFAFLTFLSSAQALVLEELKPQELQKIFENKTLGFYVGSFDPLHLGHQNLAETVVKEGLCDYVLLYPAWGGDDYKNRTDIQDRLDMVFVVFKDHPQILVTRLAPWELQERLTRPGSDEKSPREIGVKGLEIRGIIGSDVALGLGLPLENPEKEEKRQKHLKAFMRGFLIPEKYKENTIGGLMALPASSFIGALRAEDDLSPLKGYVGDRKILTVLENTRYLGLSSTKVKKALTEGQPLQQMVDPRVEVLIKRKKLYGVAR